MFHRFFSLFFFFLGGVGVGGGGGICTCVHSQYCLSLSLSLTHIHARTHTHTHFVVVVVGSFVCQFPCFIKRLSQAAIVAYESCDFCNFLTVYTCGHSRLRCVTVKIKNSKSTFYHRFSNTYTHTTVMITHTHALTLLERALAAQCSSVSVTLAIVST